MTPQYLNIPLVQLLDFLADVERNYERKNPYHNFHHAVDVTSTLFFMLRDLGAVRFFVQVDLIAIVFAAVCSYGEMIMPFCAFYFMRWDFHGDSLCL
jgi:hypothetical protein